MFNDEILEAFISGFYGCGNPGARLWFVGMEEGGGGSREQIARRLVSRTWSKLIRILLVVRSYSAYPGAPARGPESHQRSWWIVHTRPTGKTADPSGITPTQLVVHQRSWWDSETSVRPADCRLSINEPPTALVGLSSLPGEMS